MLICPKCRTTYSSSLVGVCYRDGEKLVDHERFVAIENDPLRGRLIGQKYRILERVGQGGMGTVYRAVQAPLKRAVAVKILKRELNFDRDTVARFQREANALSLLVHPNTVRVYDFGQTEDGLLYLAMELLEGEVITQKMQREGALEVVEAVRFTQQILRSLAEAHQHAIVHRDLKPDNIFVARLHGHNEPVIKLLDFGIAKIAAAERPIDQFETQAGTVFGTPRYMSPEQAQGAPIDGRSDLYSVGTLLYQMLTGRAPFTDEDAVVVMAKHIREIPDRPRVVAPDRPIPASLDEVVMRSLAKEPGARYQEAAEFDAALEACIPELLALRAQPSAFPGERRMGRSLRLGVAGLCLSLTGYAGYRAFAPEPASVIASAPLEDARVPALQAPLTTPVVHPGHEEEEVLAPGPGPANVAIRSEPNGATVFRDGQRLGETPLDLLVKPEQDMVRVELRMDGFQPLAAELTARDGERLLKLTPVAEISATSARRRPGHTRRGERSGAAKPEPAAPPAAQGAKAPSTGPYERFE